MKNESGFILIGISILTALIMGVLISSSSSKLNDMLSNQTKARQFYDAELAIEKFGVLLKAAYDHANPPGDLTHTPSTTLCNSVTLASKKFCFENNSICYNREIGPAICLSLDTSLGLFKDARNNIDITPTVYVKYDLNFFEKIKYFAYSLSSALDIPTALAEDNTSQMALWRPAIPTGIVNEIEYNAGTPCNTSGVTASQCKNYRTAPKNDLNCDGTNPKYFCVHVQFCIKQVGTCTVDEKIKQTYVFFAAPAKALGD